MGDGDTDSEVINRFHKAIAAVLGNPNSRLVALELTNENPRFKLKDLHSKSDQHAPTSDNDTSFQLVANALKSNQSLRYLRIGADVPFSPTGTVIDFFLAETGKHQQIPYVELEISDGMLFDRRKVEKGSDSFKFDELSTTTKSTIVAAPYQKYVRRLELSPAFNRVWQEFSSEIRHNYL